MLKLEARRLPSEAMVYAAPLMAVVLTIVTAFLLFAAMGNASPGLAVYEMFIEPVVNPEHWPDLLVKGAPLMIIAVGLSIGFRANVWNIGGEGQYIVGSIAACGVALLFWEQEGFWILPLMAIAGIVGGMAYAAIAAFLRARYGVSEILTSLMLNYVAIQLLYYIVNGPWKDPDGQGFPQTRLFNDSENLPHITDGSVIHYGVPVAFILAIIMWIVMERTIIGYAVRVVGTAPAAARHGGFSESRTIWFALLAGGGFAGLAGMLEAAGPFGQLTPQFPANYGYTAIIVAFLGRLHPLGIIVAALVLAVTYVGGELAQSAVGVPQASAGMFQATMLFYLLALDVLVRFRIVFKKRAAA
jgi:simple sugar transport system permease protein